jgi:hypothetical protein
MTSLENDHLAPTTENALEASMEASKNLLAFPATPEQAHIPKSRTDEVAGYTDDEPMTGSSLKTPPPATADTRDWSDSDPIRMLDIEYSQGSLASTHQEENVADDGNAATAPSLKTVALEEELTNLRLELAHQSAEYTQRLDAEHAWCQNTVQQASDVACKLRDANVVLTAEVDQLRSRVAQLELETAEQLQTRKSVNEDEQKGNEQLIAALQVEIGDLERQLHKAQRARIAAAETEEAALLRAEMLHQQVEQMVDLLESERIEKDKLIEALKAASILPS